jgi:hypothetical protein
LRKSRRPYEELIDTVVDFLREGSKRPFGNPQIMYDRRRVFSHPPAPSCRSTSLFRVRYVRILANRVREATNKSLHVRARARDGECPVS